MIIIEITKKFVFSDMTLCPYNIIAHKTIQ